MENCTMRGDAAELPTSQHNHIADSFVSPQEALQIRYTDTLKSAVTEDTSGKTNSHFVNRIYDRQFGLHGGAIHKAAIVYLGMDQ
jgi:hypothetical protein